jgi:hypothetical protein
MNSHPTVSITILSRSMVLAFPSLHFTSLHFTSLHFTSPGYHPNRPWHIYIIPPFSFRDNLMRDAAQNNENLAVAPQFTRTARLRVGRMPSRDTTRLAIRHSRNWTTVCRREGKEDHCHEGGSRILVGRKEQCATVLVPLSTGGVSKGNNHRP